MSVPIFLKSSLHYSRSGKTVFVQDTKSHTVDLGTIYRLQSGKIEACPYNCPCIIFDNPYDAIQYIRNQTGTH